MEQFTEPVEGQNGAENGAENGAFKPPPEREVRVRHVR